MITTRKQVGSDVLIDYIEHLHGDIIDMKARLIFIQEQIDGMTPNDISKDAHEWLSDRLEETTNIIILN